MQELQPGADVFRQDADSSAAALIPALIGGVVGALIGGAIWAAVAVITDYEVGWVAIGIGALAGFGVLVASGRKRGVPFQTIAVATAVIGIGIGKYLSLYFLFREAVGIDFGLTSREMSEMFSLYLQEGLEAIDILFVVLAVVTAWGIPSVKRAQPKPKVTTP